MLPQKQKILELHCTPVARGSPSWAGPGKQNFGEKWCCVGDPLCKFSLCSVLSSTRPRIKIRTCTHVYVRLRDLSNLEFFDGICFSGVAYV